MKMKTKRPPPGRGLRRVGGTRRIFWPFPGDFSAALFYDKEGKIMNAMYFVALGSITALLFAMAMFARVKKQPVGTPEMAKISGAVSNGANAYLKRQYKGVGIFFAVVFLILLAMAAAGLLSFFTPFAFITGGFFSGLSGFIGMRTATMANCRTANAASNSLNQGLRIAFSAGSVMGFTVVGLGLLDLSIWYFFLK